MTDLQQASYFARFREALDQGERPSRVIMFADIVGSTEMKSKGEVTWLPTVGKFYDVVEEAVAATNGTIVKYLGDGAIAVYSDEFAVEAINAAILIQEQLESLRHGNVLQCQCSIGITTGRPVEFTVSGSTDFIGATVDLAARLCGAANPNAIWADANTVSAANMARVTSRVGNAMRRGVADYRTGEESVRLRGFVDQVRYHEIVWSTTPFGVRNSVVTQIVNDENIRAGMPVPDVASQDDSRAWSLGQVKAWNLEKGFGFIRGDAEVADRFVLKHWLVSGESLTPGSRVAFHPLPPLADKKSGVAVRVVELDVPTQGQVAVIPDARDYVFVELRDADRSPHKGLVFCMKPAGPLSIGDWVSVMPSVDRSGRLALRVLEKDG